MDEEKELGIIVIGSCREYRTQFLQYSDKKVIRSILQSKSPHFDIYTSSGTIINMKFDLLRTIPSIKEVVEKAAFNIVTQHPELFAVAPPRKDSYSMSIIAHTHLMFDDGMLKLQISITRNLKNGAITQEIDIIDTHFKVIYRLDVVSGIETDEEMARWEQLGPQNDEMAAMIKKFLTETFGTSGNTIVSRHDNWSETEITTDDARKLIENGKPTLPPNTRITLLDLMQQMGNTFPFLSQ